MAFGTVAFLTCLAAGIVTDRMGHSGDWTAYLFVVVGGAFFAGMPYVPCLGFLMSISPR
jgi:hypothetical protein